MRQITIGRLPSNDVSLSDKSVSREHCILTVHSDGRCELTDCDSTNGTFVNGNRIHGTVPLRPNDYVRVGNQQLPWRNYVYEDFGSRSSDRSNDSGGLENTTGGRKDSTGMKWGIVGGLLLVIVILALSLGDVFNKGGNPPHNPKTDPMLAGGVSGVRTNVPGVGNGGGNASDSSTSASGTTASGSNENMTIADSKSRQTFEGEWEFQNESYVFGLTLHQQGNQLYGSYSYADTRGYMDDEPENSIRGTVTGNTATISFHSAARGGGGKASMTLQSDGSMKWKFKEADNDNHYLFDYIVPDLSVLQHQ